MLTISKSQYKTFGDQLREKFILEVVPEVRKKFPENTWELSEEEMFQAVGKIVDRAATYKIDIKRDVRQFVLIEYRFGAEFENEPRFKEVLKVLQHKTLTGTRKMQKVMDIIFKLD